MTTTPPPTLLSSSPLPSPPSRHTAGNPPSSAAPAYPDPPSPLDPSTLYPHLESYPWSRDAAFQAGLAAILGPGVSRSPDSGGLAAADYDNLALRARCFYYERRYGVSVSFDGYAEWRRRQPPETLIPLAPIDMGPQSSLLDQYGEAERMEHRADGHTNSSPTPVGGNDGNIVNHEANAIDGLDGQKVETNASLHSQDDTHTSTSQPDIEPEYPASFAEVMQLIKENKPIPGIKEIPETILVGQGTSATKAQRRKPWEKD